MEDGTFFGKLFGKRNKFLLCIFYMPVLSSNIPSSHRLHDFIPCASELYLRMVAKGGNSNKIRRQVKELFKRKP